MDLTHELIAAGIEGGSKRAIEEEWGLLDVERQRRIWRRDGPPVHIAVAVFASAWGVKLTADDEPDAPDLGDVQIAGPSIAELAALAGGALVGDDTLAASGVIARKLKGA